MSDLLRSPSVRAWAYGHTHFNNDQVMHGARVLSNQRGYPSAQHRRLLRYQRHGGNLELHL